MRINLIITGLNMGGAEKQVCDLADELSMLGHLVQLISISGTTVVKPKCPSVDIVELSMSKSMHGFIRAYMTAREIIKKFNPDIVHSHMVHANIFSRLIRITLPFPKLISTSHNSYEGHWVRALICRLTNFLATISTNVSKEATECIIKRGSVSRDKVITIYNGIKLDNFKFNQEARERFRTKLKIDTGVPLLLSVGRLSPAKDYPNLLHAFSSLKYDGGLKPQLAIIGDGALCDQLKILASDLDIADRVHWLGTQNNVAEWLSAADVFVLSSAWEGFGLVVAEAMATERVVVATDCGGVKEVLQNNGYLVQPGSYIELAEAIDKALDLSSIESENIGRNARQFVLDNFSMKKITDTWVDLYKTI